MTEFNIDNILNNQEITDTLPDTTSIAFHWIAKQYGTSIGEKNIERVGKFAQLEQQRTFYVVVHGLRDEQVDELKESFKSYDNVKVLKFSSLKLDKKYDLPISYKGSDDSMLNVRSSQYLNDVYSEEGRVRIHLSNEIDLMKYHLAINCDQIVGSGKPLAVFDFDTLPLKEKKIGEVKITKGGVMLAYLPKDLNKQGGDIFKLDETY